MYFAAFPTILAAEHTGRLKMVEENGESSVHVFAAFPTILAAEYTAGLKLVETNGESSVHVLCCFSYNSGRRVHSRAE